MAVAPALEPLTSEGHQPSFPLAPVAAKSSQISGVAQRHPKLIAAALSLLLLLVGFWPSFEAPGGRMDEGMVLVYPELVRQGAVPYRDFETLYAPANLWVLSVVYSVFGANITVERSVGLIYRVVILLGIFGLAQRWGPAVATGCMLVAGCLLIDTGIVAYSWMGAMACAICALWVMTRRPTTWRCFGAGLLAGLALLFRVDVGPAIILAALPLMWALSWEQRLSFITGGAVGIAPLAVVAAIAGPHEVLNNLFLTPVFGTSAGRHLPLLAAEPALVRLFFAHVVAVVVNAVAGGLAALEQPRDKRNLVVLSVALFTAGVSHQAYQRLDLIHLLFAAFLSIGMLPLSLAIIASKFGAPAQRTRVAVYGTCGVAAAVCIISPPIGQMLSAAFSHAVQTRPSPIMFVEKDGRSFPVGSMQSARSIGTMLAKLERLSKSGERLFVGPGDLRRTNYSDTFIYHLMPKLRPATYFVEMNPLSANRPNSRLADDVRSADWLVLNRTWDQWDEPNRSQEYGSEAPNRAVRDHFELVGEYGPFGLFQRKR